MTIQALKPNVSRDEAIRAFHSGIFSSAYWRIRNGSLQRIADAYVPFWVYEVRYEVIGSLHTRIFAMDAVHGALDLFEFPHVPAGNELIEVETRNRLVPQLAPKDAGELVRTKILRVLFQRGFFRMRALQVEIARLPGEIHLPYWLAFYGDYAGAKCRVLDAVRRRIEGGKAASFFETWLAA